MIMLKAKQKKKKKHNNYHLAEHTHISTVAHFNPAFLSFKAAAKHQFSSPAGFAVSASDPPTQTALFVCLFVSSEGALYVILPYDYPAAAAAPTF